RTPPARRPCSPLSLPDALPIYSQVQTQVAESFFHFVERRVAEIAHLQELVFGHRDQLADGRDPFGLEAIAGADGEFQIGNRLIRSEEHTSELQSRENIVCRLLL